MSIGYSGDDIHTRENYKCSAGKEIINIYGIGRLVTTFKVTYKQVQ
jgi:hypothetical protein